MGKLSPLALQLSALLISTLIYLDFCAAGNPVFQDHGYYEGNRCDLENGEGEGVCMKLTDCSSRMEEIKDGRYSGADRCGFSNFEEIVCCAERSRSVRSPLKKHDSFAGGKKRPAKTACENYKKIINEMKEKHPLNDGVKTRRKEFPHTVALAYPTAEGERGTIGGMKYICAGALISQKHVLTSARCVSNIRELVPLQAMLGDDARDVDLFRTKLTQSIPVSRIVVHPRYNRSFDYDDIAILELRDSTILSDQLHPACLITESLMENRKLKSHLSLTTKDPESTRLHFFDKKSCSKIYNEKIRDQMPNGLDDNMICVSDPRRCEDSRWTDGAPLFASTGSFPSIVGVASFGRDCDGGRNLPGVYLSVYNYLDWIEEQVWPGEKTQLE